MDISGSLEADKSLSEIAKSVLSGQPGGNPKSLREKAGLLALLNLLGIVEAFYGELPVPVDQTNTAQVQDPVVASLIEAPPQAVAPNVTTGPVTQPQAYGTAAPATPTAPGPISIVSGLTKLLGSIQPATTTEGGPSQGSPSIAGILTSLDPSLIAGMLSMVASMAKSRPARAPAKVLAQNSDDAPSESGETVAEPEPGPEAAPPSPLQMLLGIDPKVLTLVLNVLAELMKSRPADTKEKATEGPREDAGTDVKQTQRESRPVQPVPGRKSGRMHRPGLGIYRSPLTPPRPVERRQTEAD